MSSLMSDNSFFSKLFLNIQHYFNMVENNKAFKAVYIRLTKDLLLEIRNNNIYRENLSKFLIDLIIEFSNQMESSNRPEIYLIDFDLLTDSFIRILESNNIQFAPVIPIQDFNLVENLTMKFLQLNSQTILFLAYTWSLFRNARNSFNFILDHMENIHENNKGIIMVNSLRAVQSKYTKDISGIHYANFMLSDITAEAPPRSSSENYKKFVHFRLFDRKNLAVPYLEGPLEDIDNYWNDIAPDINYNVKIKDLFYRLLELHSDPVDIKKMRPSYMSRLFENIVSTKEYSKMKEYIVRNELKNYKSEKKK